MSTGAPPPRRGRQGQGHGRGLPPAEPADLAAATPSLKVVSQPPRFLLTPA
ncbi:UNVERIFIED_CONTAM: hypothetical protein Sradi_5425600 [Sesamum radiatum]|uniref:Uncharacterized protein n=1 Tax=Sesamum radiatum TaxID=300843 RepID=A0AAW2LA60_SESRA